LKILNFKRPKTHGRDTVMDDEINRQLLADREITMAFNMGLRSAVYLLEKAEEPSPRGRRYLLELLKKEIDGSEVAHTVQLLMRISNDFS